MRFFRSTSGSVFFVGFILIVSLIHFAYSSCPNDCSNHGTCVGGSCHCSTDWAGVDCSFIQQSFQNGSHYVESDLPTYSWAYFIISTHDGEGLIWNITQTGAHESGDCDVYINLNRYPTRSVWRRRDISTDKQVIIQQTNIETGQWYAGVYGFIECSFEISVTVSKPCPQNCNNHGICVNGKCQCDSGFRGDACDKTGELKLNGDPIHSTVEVQKWEYFYTQIREVPALLEYTMTQTSDGDADLYLAYGQEPSFINNIAINLTTDQVSIIQIEVFQTGYYYIGVYGYSSLSTNNYEISYDISLSAPNHIDCDSTSKCSGASHGRCLSRRCRCNDGYEGDDCETKTSALAIGQQNNVTGFVNDDLWNYYYVYGSQHQIQVNVFEDGSGNYSNGDCDLFILANNKPNQTNYDYVSLTTQNNFSVVIEDALGASTWWIGVYGWNACGYTLWADLVTNLNCSNHGTWDGFNCVCQTGWAGDRCEIEAKELTNGVVINGTVNFHEWAYYYINVPAHASSLEVRMREQMQSSGVNGAVWLYMSESGFPDLFSYDQSDTSTNDLVHAVSALGQEGTYYIGVYGSPYGKPERPNNFTIVGWYPDF